MNRSSLPLLVLGVVLVTFGLNAHASILSGAPEAVTGMSALSADKGLWLIVLGSIDILVGGFCSLIYRNPQ